MSGYGNSGPGQTQPHPQMRPQHGQNAGNPGMVMHPSQQQGGQYMGVPTSAANAPGGMMQQQHPHPHVQQQQQHAYMQQQQQPQPGYPHIVSQMAQHQYMGMHPQMQGPPSQQPQG